MNCSDDVSISSWVCSHDTSLNGCRMWCNLMYSVYEYARSGELFEAKDNEKSVPCLSYGVRRVIPPFV
jgi:hypothetical protein